MCIYIYIYYLCETVFSFPIPRTYNTENSYNISFLKESPG